MSQEVRGALEGGDDAVRLNLCCLSRRGAMSGAMRAVLSSIVTVGDRSAVGVAARERADQEQTGRTGTQGHEEGGVDEVRLATCGSGQAG